MRRGGGIVVRIFEGWRRGGFGRLELLVLEYFLGGRLVSGEWRSAS